MALELTYPGFTKKAVAFTIDDGNVKYDMELIKIFRKYGINGSFNLPYTASHIADKEMYKGIYEGFGISNHCAHHPYAFDDDVEYRISNEPFDPDTSDPAMLYPILDQEGFYFYKRPRGWRKIAEAPRYIEAIKEADDVLGTIFDRSVRGYVWPFFYQNSREVIEYVYSHFASVRSARALGDEGGFSAPTSFIEWQYNATEANLLSLSEEYIALADDGELKLFTFGVHASDYVKRDKLGDLEIVCARLGGQPDKYYTAPIDDIFDYLLATRSLKLSDGCIENDSDIDVYFLLDGERVVLHAGESITTENKAE